MKSEKRALLPSMDRHDETQEHINSTMTMALDSTKTSVTILDLPSELVAHIALFLEDLDLSSIRLSHSHLERSCLSYFGKRFFRKKGYLLTSPSLAILQGISEHDELRKYVQHVWFNPDLFTFRSIENSRSVEPDHHLNAYNPNDDAASSQRKSKYRREAFLNCMRDHDELLSKAATRLHDILAYVFQNLPHLEVVGMRRSENHAPWGWRSLKEIIGEDPRVLGPIPLTPARTFSDSTLSFVAIVKALASSATPLRSLYTDGIQIDHIPPGMLDQSVLNAACQSMWYLEVNAVKGEFHRNSPKNEQEDGPGKEDAEYVPSNIPPDRYGEGIVRLLKAMPRLRDVGLQIFPDHGQSHFIAQLHRDPLISTENYSFHCMSKIAHSVRLDHLERLKLDKITTSPDTLHTFLSPCGATLRSLKFRDIRLISNQQHPKAWKPIFAFLSTSCPKLSYILFHHLMHQSGGVSFVQDPHLALPSWETDGTNNDQSPPPGEPAGGEAFTQFSHIALEARGLHDVKAKMERCVEGHWYQKPIFSYALDEEMWHTDTSEEELP